MYTQTQSSWYLTASLVIVAGILGMATGYFLTPEYAMYDKTTMTLGRPDRLLDLRYINAMIAHHRGAILLAEQAREMSKRPEIRDLAEEITVSEPKLIAELYTWKLDWYGDRRKAVDPIVPRLGAYTDTFDLRFLNALIAHHEAGIVMTREVRLKSSRAEILDNADAVEVFLKKSGDMLQDWRKNWYNL